MPVIPAQEWVNTNLTDKSLTRLLLTTREKENVLFKEQIGVGGELTGDLILENYPQLEEVEIERHKLTSLIIINCPNLKSLDVSDNGLTKLEIQGTNQLKELIASNNNLTSLDLTNCQQIKELLISDNPNLKELKNLNQTILDNFNKVNTQIDLNKEEKELEKEKGALFEVVKGVNEMGKQHELVLVEPIFSPEQNTEAMRRLLTRTRDKWSAYFEDEEAGMPTAELAKKHTLLHLAFQFPNLRDKAEKILIKISGVIEENYSYKELLKEWNGDEDENKPYNPFYDFDFALFAYLNHLRADKPLKIMWNNQLTANPIFWDFIHNN